MSRIVVLGAGESGAGAAVLAKVKGFDTFVSDMSAIKSKYKEMLVRHLLGRRTAYRRADFKCRRSGEKPRHPQ